MLLEDQRFLHEDLERLEQAISDRTAEDPRHVRNFLCVDPNVIANGRADSRPPEP